MYQQLSHIRFLLLTLTAVHLCPLAESPAFAASASPWVTNTVSLVRIVAAQSRVESGNSILRAGIEIKLHSGWFTAWRYVDAEVAPPLFDFSGSENIKSVTVMKPKADQMVSNGTILTGYKDGVLLPMRVFRRDESKSATLRINLDYAACELLCVPAKAQVELALSGNDSDADFEDIVSAAEAQVPKGTQR